MKEIQTRLLCADIEIEAEDRHDGKDGKPSEVDTGKSNGQGPEHNVGHKIYAPQEHFFHAAFDGMADERPSGEKMPFTCNQKHIS